MSATMLNGTDAAELRAYIERCMVEPGSTERRPVLTGVWTGGDRSRVSVSGTHLDVNGPGTLGPMQLVLAALVSCEIDVMATGCTLMGVEIDELVVEASGAFDVRSYLGIAGGPRSGYERISYTARLRAPSLTEAQLERLRTMVEQASPVGDTLVRSIRLEGTIERA